MAEGLLVRELSRPLRCSVLLASGCQDNQVSLDGTMNGRSTQEPLTVWGDGLFKGDYARFHQAIVKGMPKAQRPDFFTVGQPSPAFLGQRPFSV